MVLPDHILHWIENLPDPSAASLKRTGRKRCWGEMSDTVHQAQQTPERRPRIPTPNTSLGGPEVDEATPRPPPSTRSADVFAVPELRPSPSASSASSVRSSATRSTTGSSQSRGVKRRKNESPKRLLQNLTLARYSVEQQSIGTLRDLPEGARKLAENMRRCEKRAGILHEDIRAVMEPHIDPGDDELFSDQRACVGASAPYADIVDLVDTANEMEGEFEHEAAWNSGVHHPLLRIALRHSTWRQELRCHNVTVASIESDAFDLPGDGGWGRRWGGGREVVGREPSYHLPADDTPPAKRVKPAKRWSHRVGTRCTAQDAEGPDRKIDFSIGLRLSDQNKMDLFRSTSAVNPTLHAPTRFVPTTVHIETKLTGEGMREAQSQLLHWLPRHIAKLRELLALAGQPENTPIPVLPVLVVQGHDWKCLYYEDQVTKARLLSRKGCTVGSTGSVVDAYAVVAALQYLMEWSQSEYRPWFEEMILRPLLAKAQV